MQTAVKLRDSVVTVMGVRETASSFQSLLSRYFYYINQRKVLICNSI